MANRFDVKGFFASLDAHRAALGLQWKDVANDSGVSASTLTRLSQGRRTDLDSLAKLVKWSGISADQFMQQGRVGLGAPAPLAQISALLRQDKNLGEEGVVALEEMIKAAYERLRRQK